MNWHHRIRRQHADCSATTYAFTIIGADLTVDAVIVESRKSTRHKWTSIDQYRRILGRGTDRDEPEIPVDVIEEALNAVRAKIQFKKWSR